MRALLTRITRSTRGAAALEFAIAAPVLLVALIGAVQMGVLFFANAGLRNAVGEGARMATIFPQPSEDRIRARLMEKRLGLKTEHMGTPTIVPGVTGSSRYVDITMRYTVPLNFVFFQIPPVTLVETRRAYVHRPN